jgi:peptide/nickel transport system ATP-binding protein
MGSILEVRDLSVHYFTSKGVVRAVDGITFSLRPGETLGVVGESGCGKTTAGTALLKMPSPPGRIVGGQVILEGTDVLALSENEVRRRVRWQRIAMVFQGAMNCLTPVYTVGKQMTETLQQHRPTERREAQELVERYLRLVGLPEGTTRRYPHELSGGMKQRVVIATALFLEPDVVILDEPTTALDVIVQAQILNLLKALREELDLSFIFITHDLATEAEVADRILVMYAGRMAELGSNEEIFGAAGPAHPYTQKLLAATPRIHQRVEELSFIPGAPPDLLDPPRGCRFHLRCHVVMERCSREEPPLFEVGPGHNAACWRCARG